LKVRQDRRQNGQEKSPKRWYRVYIADEEILLASNPDDPVVSVIEDIYKNAIKG